MLSTQHYDVVVCGGGPAGFAGAIAAAGQGARTLLIERFGHLGGMMTGARVSCFCDSPGGPVFDELIGRLHALDAATLRVDPEKFRDPGRYRYHIETAKALLMEMAVEAGVEVLLETVAFEPLMRGPRVIGVKVANKGGAAALYAPVVIDATADADVAAAAGAACLIGDPDDGRIQMCNYRWSLGGVDWDRYRAEAPEDAELTSRLRRANRDGRLQAPPSLFGLDPACFPWDDKTRTLCLGNWELQGVNPADPAQSSRTVAACQVAAIKLVRFLREALPGFKQCRIEALAATLGTRESRRIVGRYRVSEQDVLTGARHPDAVARAWFWIDLHDPPPGSTIPYGLDYVRTHRAPDGSWYDIPWRSLLPESVEGLIVAGRCICCDRPALGSLRVMPTCMFMGYSAGYAAACAAAGGLMPHRLDGAALSASLGLAGNR